MCGQQADSLPAQNISITVGLPWLRPIDGAIRFYQLPAQGLQQGSRSSPLTPTPQRPFQAQARLGALVGKTISCPAVLRAVATAGNVPALGP